MRQILLLLAVLLLAACNQPQKPGQNNPAPVAVTVKVIWPTSTQYQSLVVSTALARGGQPSAPLTLTRPNASGTLSAPAGDDVFTVKVYDAGGGSGNLVSQTSVRQTVGSGLGNVLNLSFASPTTPIDHLDVSLVTASLAPGQTTAATATARDASGNALLGLGFTWASSAPVVATVDSGGNVKAVAVGSALISATETTSGKAGSATLTVTTTPTPPTPPAPSSIARVEVGPASGTIPQGAKSQLLAKAFDAQNNEVPTAFSWVSSNPSVLGVSSSGQVSAQNRGSSNVTVSAGGKSATATLSVGAASTAQPSASWSALEPTTYSYVYDLVVAADGTQYTSAIFGLFKRNGGLSWAPVYAEAGGTDPYLYSLKQLTADPANANRLWAFDGGQSLYLSTNSGLTWVVAVSGANLGKAQYHPLNSSVLYAGRYRSSDGGATWKYFGTSAAESRLLWSPANASLMYDFDLSGKALKKSTDGGVSWSPVTLPVTNYSRLQDAGIDAAGTLYFLIWDNGSTVYSSSNQGAGWTGVNVSSSLSQNLFFSSSNQTLAYLSGGPYSKIVAYSINAGVSWTSVATPFTLPYSSSPSSPGAYADPSQAGVIYTTNTDPSTGKPSVYTTSNYGANWQSTGISASPVGVRKIGSQTFLFTDIGLWSSTDGQTWSRTSQNRGLVRWTYSGADRTSVNRLLALPYVSADGGQNWSVPSSSLPGGTLYQSPQTASRWWLAGANGDVFLSTDNLNSAPWVGRVPYQTSSVLLAPSATNDQLIYAGGTGGVYKSGNAGATWNVASNGLQHATVTGIVVNPTNDQMVFVATGHAGVFKSTDGAASWQAANRGLGNLETTSICLAADNSTLVAGTNDGGVYVSLDQGGTWGWSSSIGSYSVNGVACDPSDPNVIYAATTEGVYKSVDKGSSWTQASVGLTTPYDQRVWVSPDGQTLYLQTQDQGVFKGQPSASGGAGFRTQSVKKWLELQRPSGR